MASRGDQGNGNIYSDDFQNATLGTWWTEGKPGESDASVSIVGAGTGQAVCRLTMPTDQDYYHPFSSVWIEQDSIADESFVFEAWLVGHLDDEDDTQFGIEIHEATRGTNHFGLACYVATGNLFVEFQEDGTTIGSGLSPTVATSLGLRLEFTHESGGTDSDSVAGYYNADDGGWFQIETTQTARDLTIEAVRVFGGRFDPAPAFDLDIDWAWETSAPVDPEDGLPSSARRVMVIS